MCSNSETTHTLVNISLCSRITLSPKFKSYFQPNFKSDPGIAKYRPDRKKVSCWSLAGCCWGWNSESKFQKELSMKLFVGISVKLCSGSQSRGFFCFAGIKKQERYLYSDSHGHLPHFQEDLPELRSHLHQWVQVATVGHHAQGVKVIWLKFFLLPASTEIST